MPFQGEVNQRTEAEVEQPSESPSMQVSLFFLISATLTTSYRISLLPLGLSILSDLEFSV